MFVWRDDLSCHFIVLLSVSGISTYILDISPGHQTIHPLREGKWFSRMDLPVRLSEISNNAGSNYGINVWTLCNGTCELSEKSVLHLMIHVLCCTMLHVYMFIVRYNIFNRRCFDKGSICWKVESTYDWSQSNPIFPHSFPLICLEPLRNNRNVPNAVQVLIYCSGLRVVWYV